MKTGSISFWLSRNGAPTSPPTKTVDRSAHYDVAIVGGGFSGLWTAWALTQLRRDLSIAVFESECLGYGASGRNAGWLSAKQVGVRRALAQGPGGKPAVTAMQDRLEAAITEVVDILGADEIDARHGGWTQIARSSSEQRRIEQYVAEARRWGMTESSIRLISQGEAYERVHATGITGALHSPDAYVVDPVKMVFQLDRSVIEAGVEVFTTSRVSQISQNLLCLNNHRVTADKIVVATEGYSAQQHGQRRRMLPLNSSLLVTEPLTTEQWDSVGWAHSDGLASTAHTYFYGRTTADGRIVIGGRGRPYRFGSATDRNGDIDLATVRALMDVLGDLFPDVNLEPAHAWCGVLGVTRDWSPFLDYDRQSRILRMGGYAGQGVTASYLAGLAAADLLCDRQVPLAESTWVRPAPRPWEPEPLRWLGANGFYAVYSLADQLEARSNTGKTSAIARMADKVAGR